MAAGHIDGTDLFARSDVLAGANRRNDRLVRGPKCAVAHRHDTDSRNETGVRDDAGPSGVDRFTIDRSEVDPPVAGAPRFGRRIEGPHDGRLHVAKRPRPTDVIIRRGKSRRPGEQSGKHSNGVA